MKLQLVYDVHNFLTFLLDAKDFLIRNNIEIETKMIENCDHHIPIEASSAALNYIKKNLQISLNTIY